MGANKSTVDAILNQRKSAIRSNVQPKEQQVNFVKENKKQ